MPPVSFSPFGQLLPPACWTYIQAVVHATSCPICNGGSQGRLAGAHGVHAHAQSRRGRSRSGRLCAGAGGPPWCWPISCLSADLHQPRQSLTAQGCWAAAQAVYYLVMMEWKASSRPADRWRRGDRWWWMGHMAGPERAQAAVSGMRLSHWRRPAVTCRCNPACQAASERQDAAGSAVVGLCGAAARLTCRNSSHEVHHA